MYFTKYVVFNTTPKSGELDFTLIIINYIR